MSVRLHLGNIIPPVAILMFEAQSYSDIKSYFTRLHITVTK